MKRKSNNIHASDRAAKRLKERESDYCDVAPRHDANGNTIWPASVAAIESAQLFLQEWYVLNLNHIDLDKEQFL